jgi:cytochrome c553
MLVLLAALVAPILGHALESGSQIAWTTETLKLVKNANLEKGKKIAEAKACEGCHSEKLDDNKQGEGKSATVDEGEVIPGTAIPALAGQNANYMFKQLRDYFNDDRMDALMTAKAKELTEQDAADLAVWYASLPTSRQKASSENLAVAEKMVKDGDGKRILPPCFVCHGTNGRGEKMDIPSLAGQHADYFERTLMAYKNGQRHNDIYSRMRLIAKQLKDNEIKALARYYQNMQ